MKIDYEREHDRAADGISGVSSPGEKTHAALICTGVAVDRLREVEDAPLTIHITGRQKYALATVAYRGGSDAEVLDLLQIALQRVREAALGE